MFEREIGPVGQRPEMYWTPVLGNSYVGPGLRPCDIGDLTPAQLFAAQPEE